MAKIVAYGPAARLAVARALEAAHRLAAPTLGPLARTVLIERRLQPPRLAATALEALEALGLDDRVAQSVVELLQEAARRVRADGGGVATWLVLTRALLRSALKAIEAGAEPLALARDIDAAERRVQEALARGAVRPTKRAQLLAVARSAAPDSAAVLEQVVDDLGRGGAVIVEDSKQAATTVSRVEGLQFAGGWASAHFVNKPETGEVVMEGARVLLYEPKIGSTRELAPFLERVAVAADGGRPLLMVVGAIDPEPIATIVVNRLRGALHACVVTAPAAERPREELLLDLAAATGARPILAASAAPLADVALDQLGRVRRALVDRDKTTITLPTDPPAALADHLRGLRRALEAADLPLVERDDLQERIARLSGRLVQIYAGGATDTEVALRKADLQAAVRAVRGAIERGVVAGGGSALRDARAALEGAQDPGAEAVRAALAEPMLRIAANAGISATRVRAVPAGRALDVTTGRVVDPFEAGLLDPLPSVSVALQAAASIASVLLSSEAVVAEASRMDAYVPPGIEQAWEAAKRAR
jgi:chaperonin GroEL